VEGFRWALLGKTPPDTTALLSSLAIVVVLLVSGLWYFHKMERTFADLI
jgi:lipopolysaccharide transport system permease protein